MPQNNWTTLLGREIWGSEIESHVTINKPNLFKKCQEKFHGSQTQNRGLYQIVGEAQRVSLPKNNWTTLLGREIWGSEIESHVTIVYTTVTVM